MDEKSTQSGDILQKTASETTKQPITKFTKEELLKGIDDSFQQENPPVKKQQNENDPLIIRIAHFIDERYELRMDQVRNVLEVRDKSGDVGFKKDERFESNLIVELLCAGFKGVASTVGVMLSSTRYVKHYHPVRYYFESLPAWDGVDRFSILASCLVTTISDQQALLKKHLRKHLLRCIASVFVPGFFNKHCFVIVGTGQSMGKTTFIRRLLPKSLEPYITDAVLEWKDKDANIALGSNWIINLDELANLNRDETNSLKATLSRDSIKIRRPYDRIDSEIPRLANFFGSTNDLQFLTDLTGNVRWICFRIAGIDFSYNDLDKDQLWAQLYKAFRNGEDYVLSREELQENDKRNEAFMVTNAEVDAIQLYLMPGIKDIEENRFGGKPSFASTSQLMKLINEKGHVFRSEKKFGQALQACGFHRCSERDKVKGYSIYGYWYFEVEGTRNFNNE